MPMRAIAVVSPVAALVASLGCGPTQSAQDVGVADQTTLASETVRPDPRCGESQVIDQPIRPGPINVGNPPWATIEFHSVNDVPNTKITIRTANQLAGMFLELDRRPINMMTPVQIKVHLQHCDLSPGVKFLVPGKPDPIPADKENGGWAILTLPWADFDYDTRSVNTTAAWSGFVIASN